MRIIIGIAFQVLFYGLANAKELPPAGKPNIIYILVDQWRAQATGYSGDKNAVTPNLDRLAGHSLNVKNAVSGMPVCTPHRASLLTGQYPLTTGVFMNDVMLDTARVTMAEVFSKNGYSTGFIGKWHVDGHGRKSYIPANRRQGFEYWKALECSHDYNNSLFYAGNSDAPLKWDGYDAIAQSNDACGYIAKHGKSGKPFLLLISLAPPHDPYQTAPKKYRDLYENKDLVVNANVPTQFREKALKDLKGYYAHITALDDCIGKIWSAVKAAGIENNSIIIFTADHGDLLGAHGSWNKQQPYEESIRVPFLIHYPAALGNTGKASAALLNTPDIMPTLLGFSGIRLPAGVEGKDFSKVFTGKMKDDIDETLIACVQPFGQWNRKQGGKEYRGIVTRQYTYVRDREGPWLLFDNSKDPLQLENLIDQPENKALQDDLDARLKKLLLERKDDFRPGMEYVKKWKYVVDETETVPYIKMNYEGKPIREK
ncbi:MAG: sulfatase [Chitinophagaceae bacterium]